MMSPCYCGHAANAVPSSPVNFTTSATSATTYGADIALSCTDGEPFDSNNSTQPAPKCQEGLGPPTSRHPLPDCSTWACCQSNRINPGQAYTCYYCRGEVCSQCFPMYYEDSLDQTPLNCGGWDFQDDVPAQFSNYQGQRQVPGGIWSCCSCGNLNEPSEGSCDECGHYMCGLCLGI